jgi:PHD/YefM family antitoxin component YafN of YafNO toxin-antitoxin module
MVNVVTLLHFGKGIIMTITTLSSREFNQDASKAKKAAASGPVFITDRGRPAHVLLTMEEYQKITRSQTSIVDLLAMPGVADIDFIPPRLADDLYRTADLS